MKELWERRRPYLELDTAALASLIEPFLPNHHVTTATRMVGGLANTIYKLDVEGFKQPLVLRLYTRDHTACQKDVDIYRLVRDHIPVPELFYADINGTGGGVPYVITEFVRGSMLHHALANNVHTMDSLMAEVGRMLAKIGTLRWQQTGFFGPELHIDQPIVINGESHTAYINGSLFDKGGVQRTGVELAQQILELLHTHAHLLDELEGQAALVHADFNPHNILVEQQDDTWKVTAVLDWEFAFAGPSLFDIGNMLRNEHRMPPVSASQFIAGYTEAGGQIPNNWQKQIKLLDLLNLCDLLPHAQPGDVVARDLVELIQQTLLKWSNA